VQLRDTARSSAQFKQRLMLLFMTRDCFVVMKRWLTQGFLDRQWLSG